jgi:purine-binding chemotaxis protein CheW
VSGLAGKYMTFKLASEEYGLGILTVRELIGLMEITRVPRTPPFIRGVINLRGRVIPVMDLRARFGMAATEATDQTVIIVVQVEGAEGALTIGVLVDEVLEVLNIDAAHIEPPPSYGTGGVDGDFILGVGKSGHRVVFLLDIDQVISTRDQAALSTAAA